jgi:hypothetical protein
MAGMDIKQVKELTYGKMALMGNVQCSYLYDCSDERIIAEKFIPLQPERQRKKRSNKNRFK